MNTRAPLKTLLLVVLVTGVAAAAWAASVTQVSTNPSSITAVQGSSTPNGFKASIDSITGLVPQHPRNAPYVYYCSEFTIHGDSSITCDTTDYFALTPGRNYSQDPVKPEEYVSPDPRVTVNVDSDVSCTPPNNVYSLPETFYSTGGNGIDFGNGVLQVTKYVTVTVTCANPNGYQGCTALYWKNHFGNWPKYQVNTVFVYQVFFSSAHDPYMTLGNLGLYPVLTNGLSNGTDQLSKATNLIYEAIAGVLNSASSDIYYYLEPDTAVASAVNDALDNPGTQEDGWSGLTSLTSALHDNNNLGAPACTDTAMHN